MQILSRLTNATQAVVFKARLEWEVAAGVAAAVYLQLPMQDQLPVFVSPLPASLCMVMSWTVLDSIWRGYNQGRWAKCMRMCLSVWIGSVRVTPCIVQITGYPVPCQTYFQIFPQDWERTRSVSDGGSLFGDGAAAAVVGLVW